jgi:hypothetical protein
VQTDGISVFTLGTVPISAPRDPRELSRLDGTSIGAPSYPGSTEQNAITFDLTRVEVSR